jgi:superfamily II DNA or RNA helicase
MELRPYQADCISAVLSARSRGVKRQLAVLFTAAGKTVLFSQLPKHMKPGKRMMVFAHTDLLCQQAYDKMKIWNPSLRVGMEKAEFRAGSADVVVASMQSLGRENDRIKQFNTADFEWLVIDEAHHAVSDSYKRIINHFGLLEGDFSQVPTTLVNFTATPNRADGVGLSEVADEIVYQFDMQAGVKAGWLVTPRGYRIRTETDISGVSSNGGEYAKSELELAVNNPKRNELIAKEWIQCAWPRQTIVFCVDVQHAKDQAYAFQKAGVPFEFIHGKDPLRKDKLAMFKAGKLQGLCNAQLLIEGFDMWEVACTVHARPTRSQGRFIQEVGRGLRLQGNTGNLEIARASGLLLPNHKIDSLILDVCDITSRFSLVTLPTLFGLSPKLDLHGKSVIQVIDEFEAVDKEHPGINLTNLEDATKLKSYVEEVGLFEVKFSEETAPYSNLTWHTAPAGNFVLLLPEKGEQLVVGENLLGKWSVWGKVGGVGVDEPFYTSLPEALDAAEQIVSSLGTRAMSYLRKDSKYKAKKVTDKQRALLTKWKVPAHVIEGMNAGSAGAYITKKIKEWQNKGARQ